MEIKHPLAPVFDKNSKILILGSFPSVKSREQGFYYGHPQNRFWSVLAHVMQEDEGVHIPVSIGEKRRFLLDNHIAVWDVIASCEITGSSDASIQNVAVNHLETILLTADIQTIYCNGDTSFRYFNRYTKPMLQELVEQKKILPQLLNAVRLPSTSPANAAWSLETLIGAYARIKTALRLDGMRTETAYYPLRDYSGAHFGKKLYRLSLDGGFTCPNRDGTIDTRGCIFCDAGGAGDFGGKGDIKTQIAEQKKLLAPKLPKTIPVGYIAYFQSFTGTYGNVDYLRKQYESAIQNSGIEVLDIATRPDCLSGEALELLREMNSKIPVWVELGLQTKHEKTAEYIRRGYPRKVYERAVKNLQEIGIRQIVTHVILGLPGETKRMMRDTVSYVAQSGSTGIKLQLLHVLEGTDMAGDYAEGKFDVLQFEEYLDLTAECIALLPPDMVVHRLTGDGNKRHLVAPLWSGDKKRVLNGLSRVLHRNV